MGRNMFRPIRGAWGDEDWKGWWGDIPPYHHPAFVLTHHPRPPFTMGGGTTFQFVADGIESALEQATAAAGGADVRLGGGASTVQQYLRPASSTSRTS
jgi:dihydrofolate reductase